MPSITNFPWRPKLQFILIVCLLPFVKTDQEIEHCSPDKVLSTDLVIPALESARMVTFGCTSKEMTTDKEQVHVIRAEGASRHAFLTVTVTSDRVQGLVLVLQSSIRTEWRVVVLGGVTDTFKLTSVLFKGSNLVHTNVALSHEMRAADVGLAWSSSAAQVLSQVRQEFGAVSTFSVIQDANRFSVMLEEEELPTKCTLANDPYASLDLIEPSVTASQFSLQSVTGCFNEEMAGRSASDVFIIDLEAPGPGPDNDHEPVYLLLEPEQNALERNLTLILTSKVPVYWLLQSNSMKGRLRVISQDPDLVEDFALEPSLKIQVDQTGLLDPGMSFKDLWQRATLAALGSVPVAFIKLKYANLLTLKVPEIAKQVLSQNDVPWARDSMLDYYDTPEAEKAETKVLIPGQVVDEAIESDLKAQALDEIQAKVGKMLTKNCGQSQTVVAIPRILVDQLMPSSITLNDPSCQAVQNNTHWILTTPSTSCGSINLFSGKNPMFNNNVIMHFSANSVFADHSIRVAFSCRFKPGLVDQAVDPGAGAEHDDAEANDLEMYLMTVARVTSDQQEEILATQRSDSATVSPDDVIEVSTSFETKARLNLALEKCWVTRDLMDQAKVSLVYHSCPAGQAKITVFSQGDKQRPAFRFQVRDLRMSLHKFYITCFIGLCSPGSGSGNVPRCLNPDSACTGTGFNYKASVAQQIIRRGPFFLHPFLEAPDLEVTSKATVDTSLDDLGSSIMERSPIDGPLIECEKKSDTKGVAVEVTVIIAVISFILGAVTVLVVMVVKNRKRVPEHHHQPGVRLDKNGDGHHLEEGQDGAELRAMMAEPDGQLTSTC